MKKNGETQEEYFRRLKKEDPVIVNAIQKLRDNIMVKDVFDDILISHLISLGLSYRNMANILRVGLGSVGEHVGKWRKTNSTALHHVPIIEYKRIINQKRQEVSVSEDVYYEEENVFLAISDIQAGTMVLDTRFDLDPVKTVQDYFKKLKMRLTESFDKRRISVKNFNILLLGDLVEGWRIFPKQHAIDVRSQMKVVIEEIFGIIFYALEHLRIEHINIYGVFGNHGRISKAHLTTDNYDQFVHDRIHDQIKLMKSFGHFENVTSFLDSDLQIQKHRIGKWTYLLGHGDHANTDTSGTLTKKANEALLVWGMYNVFIMGHWHSYKHYSNSGMDIIVNGCMYPSPYSMYKIMKRPDIMQLLFASSDDQAVAWTERLDIGLGIETYMETI
jgi:hypothetical protein